MYKLLCTTARRHWRVVPSGLFQMYVHRIRRVVSRGLWRLLPGQICHTEGQQVVGREKIRRLRAELRALRHLVADWDPRQHPDGDLLHDDGKGCSGRVPKVDKCHGSLDISIVARIAAARPEVQKSGTTSLRRLHGVRRLHILCLLVVPQRRPHSADGVRETSWYGHLRDRKRTTLVRWRHVQVLLLLWHPRMQRRSPHRFVLPILLLLQSVRRMLFGLPQARPVRRGNHVSTSLQGHLRTVHPHLCPRDDRSRWTASRSVLREGNRVTFRRLVRVKYRRRVRQSRHYHAGDLCCKHCGVCGRRADRSLAGSSLHVLH